MQDSEVWQRIAPVYQPLAGSGLVRRNGPGTRLLSKRSGQSTEAVDNSVENLLKTTHTPSELGPCDRLVIFSPIKILFIFQQVKKRKEIHRVAKCNVSGA
ncbi:hypothetical protein I5I61_05320 [Pseudomonas nitroreducens]|uniref:Transposase n=1 Tax=Pseudomonas nitroreducens TaxID=46680 RepID=A0ABS0KGW9_PSENT|nr:hypothetical protein [Pseudomonas nitroreducens]MBG6286861.1 hypothetical protein [Pseudomonas nitroreducens]